MSFNINPDLLCRNVCYTSLIEAAREAQKIVTTAHVNSVLIQAHWRSHEELIKKLTKLRTCTQQLPNHRH